MKNVAATLLAAGVLLAPIAAFGAEIQIGARTFTLPDGFTIELVAQSPLVDRPIEADFDELGRLYVTDSSGTNDKAEKQLIDKPHRVMLLTDIDGDGKYDNSTIFADKMMFPEGAMWLAGSLYVSAPPSIWKLTDTNHDGVADKREEWFNGTLTGCANDLHGPYLGPDGFIYWNKGAFAKQTHERPGQAPFVSRASHTFRMRPDGTGLEAVMTGGMDNPVGLAFTPEGDRFFTCTFIQNPSGGRRDALIHEIYGGVYGKPNDVLDDHPQTGDLMPVTTHLGAAAPAGVMRYESAVMGAAYRDNLFVAQFNMHKVSRHVLVRDGSTYKTEDSDFVVAADTDFHPTDVLEDADGSILIIDTGGWYKLCCPTSQLAKPDVLGAIYRVRKTGAKKPEDPWGAKIDWSKPVALFTDERPAVQKRAMKTPLGPKNASALLKDSAYPAVKMRAIWALSLYDAPSANLSIAAALGDSDSRVRITAANALSVQKSILDGAGPAAMLANSGLKKMLANGAPPEKRVASEVLGRMKDQSAIGEILQAAASGKMDRPLEHAYAYALIEIGRAGKAGEIRGGLSNPNSGARKVALIALSQLPEALSAKDVAPLLTETGELRATAEWIAAKHPEWGAELAAQFRANAAQPNFSAEQAKAMGSILAKLASGNEIQTLLGELASGKKETTLMALQAMAASGLKKAPDAWHAALARGVASADSETKLQAIATARALGAAKDSADVKRALAEIADDSANPPGLRIAALRALPEGSPVSAAAFALLLQNIEPKTSVEIRSDVVATLLRAGLSDDQRLQLADVFGRLGPMELTRLFDVFEKFATEHNGLRLVESLKKSTVLATLPPDWIDQRLAKFPDSVRKAAEALPRPSQADALAQRAHLEDLLAIVKTGDIRRGQAVFNNPKTACVSCHAMGYIGGKVGPDLTAIGQVRTEMDLLESILYPSASFVRSFEPVLVQTKDGETHTGILKGDSEKEISLVSGPNAEERLARSTIAEIRPSSVSIMPAGLESQLTKQEIADLVVFLKATKWGAN
jgi:putative membrane-bound dehydrogenase-like protein